MSTGRRRKVTYDEIERVKDLIERCIMSYMKKKEVVDILYHQHNIEPCFTRIVWRNLEEQNKKFFRNYYLRLAVKDQIARFRNLLQLQAGCNLAVQPVPFDFGNIGSLGLQHSCDHHQFNTLSAQNPNVGMIEQGCSSSSNMNSNSHKLERTFTDELSAFLSPQPGCLFDFNGVTVENEVAGPTTACRGR